MIDDSASGRKQMRINLYRASLHPEGFAAITTTFHEWGSFLVQQLRALAEESLDGTLGELLTEVMAYPNVRALSDRTRDVAVDHRILLQWNCASVASRCRSSRRSCDSIRRGMLRCPSSSWSCSIRWISRSQVIERPQRGTPPVLTLGCGAAYWRHAATTLKPERAAEFRQTAPERASASGHDSATS